MEIILGNQINLQDLVNVARNNYKVSFSQKYRERVLKSQALVTKWVNEKRVMYGITTGFGSLCDKIISYDDAIKLQENIVLTHSTSVGEPLSIEEVRATMFMILQNAGQGYSGIRLETLEMYRGFLNKNISPFAPKEGSVGYLCVEAHIALAFLGKGKVFYNGELQETQLVLEQLNIKPIILSFKEGLVLTSSTTSPTAIGALALYDMLTMAKTADIIGAMSLEVLKGTTRAFDERIMSIRPHKHQLNTAKNLRRILADSEMAQKYYDYRLQDALSLRSMPQGHGAAKKTLEDALQTFETEMNSCCDNPVIWPDGDDGETISGCNCDSGFVGIAMDTAAIAATYLAKISERRNNRLINGSLSENPSFLIKNAGLNSGLMIPQYTQAGLLNDMKILSTPATIDNIPTCTDQEDYVAMGYNACKKARKVADNLSYILSIELLSVYQSHQFVNEYKYGSATGAVIGELTKTIPFIENDIFLYPHIIKINELIKNKKIIELVENEIGTLE